MNLPQQFGDFSAEVPSSQEYLLISFSPSSIPLQQRWRNNGLSADFLADYLTTFFPSREEPTPAIDQQAEIKSAVSFIANELLENAMKFNDETSQHPITISLHLCDDRLVFRVTNSIPPHAVGVFQAFLQELTTTDPGELYIRCLENAAEATNNSGLGFVTIMNDYLAKLGWQFETVQQNPQIITVTTMVQLTV